MRYLKNYLWGDNQNWQAVLSDDKLSSCEKRMIFDKQGVFYWQFFAEFIFLKKVHIPRTPFPYLTKLEYDLVYWYK